MNLLYVCWMLSGVVSLFVGIVVVILLFGANQKLEARKRSAQALAAKLRAKGLVEIPALLDDYVVGDVRDAVERIHEFARLIEIGGDDAICKELDGTFAGMLAAKLATADGLAFVQAQVAAATAAPAPAPAAPAPAPAKS